MTKQVKQVGKGTEELKQMIKEYSKKKRTGSDRGRQRYRKNTMSK